MCKVLKTRNLGEVNPIVRSFIEFSKQKVGVMTKHHWNRISNRQDHLGFCSWTVSQNESSKPGMSDKYQASLGWDD